VAVQIALPVAARTALPVAVRRVVLPGPARPAARLAAVAVVAVVGADEPPAADARVETEQMNMKNFKHTLKVAVMAGLFAMASAAFAQTAYPTPDAAASALVGAIARNDSDAIKTIVGPDYRKYVPVDAVSSDDVATFLEAWASAHAIVPAGADKAFLGAGKNGWTLPIPIVKTAAGWKFDVKAAPEEMRARRIGRNELAAIQVALAYTDAQKEYKARDWNGDGVSEYAMRGLSSAGKRDGLYWASLPGEPESPLGPEFADAKPGQPYHGYLFKILTAQGKDAPGGAKSYIRNGHMTEGYALVAWPARYADTGVMTFIVNQDGVVYEKNLGPATGAAAQAITAYNPDASWSKVAPAK
jgi:hypothetical protein